LSRTGAVTARCHNLTGETELDEAVDLLAVSAAVVSNDSGLMHVAAALDRPLVAIYGPTSAGFTPPLQSQARTIAVPLDCAPCFKRECPLEHHRCMRDLSPSLVWQQLESLENAGGNAT
jgi:heptosyltransferase-2